MGFYILMSSKGLHKPGMVMIIYNPVLGKWRQWRQWRQTDHGFKDILN